ncbi:MAG: hypothetical protein GYA50_01415 [Eubacteriaceae bacterium]|nr:hypothetical protein [Eubacteriaceae bacterium]
MDDFILFAILLILIAASVALVFLILFGDSSKKSSVKAQKSSNGLPIKDEFNKSEFTKNDIELMKKFCHTFSDAEINQFKEIDKKIDKIYKKSDNYKY